MTDKINYVYSNLELIGGYDYINKIIFLDIDLKKFPKLKNKILEHEKKHILNKNILQALINDFKDYPKLFSDDDFIKFKEYKQRNVKNKFLCFYVIMLYQIFQNFIFIYAYFYSKIYRLFRK